MDSRSVKARSVKGRSVKSRLVDSRLVPRTISSRLVAGLLALLAVTFAGVGLAVTTALDHYLVNQLDQRLADAGGRYAASLEHGGAATRDHAATPAPRAPAPSAPAW